MAKSKIYKIHAQLRDSNPKVSRTFLISETATMAKLGYTIMALFRMQASHLFCFDIPVKENLKTKFPDCTTTVEDFDYAYELYSGRKDLRVEIISGFSEEDEHTVLVDALDNQIKHIFDKVGEKAILNYDFGDDWHVDFMVKKIYTDEQLDARQLPLILEGKGLGILEDIGGVEMLNQITKAYQRQKGELYQEYVEYLGEDIDFKSFDLDSMNAKLKKLIRIHAKAYEKRESLTDKEIELLTKI